MSYRLSDIPGFNNLLFDIKENVLNEDKENKDKENTLKLCKTNIVTRNNQQYKVIRYDKKFLTPDLFLQDGLLRSVIVNGDNKVVSFAPPKSIVWDTFIAENPIKTDDIVAEEFVEGTMINVFWDSSAGLAGSWELATRNSVGGEVSFFKTQDKKTSNKSENPNKTFRDMFLEAAKLNSIELNMLDPNFCYSFVLQHPENRIVVPFKTPQLYLVEVYEICNSVTSEGINVYVHPVNMQVVKYFGLWNSTSIKFPEIYEWDNYEDLKEHFASMNTSYEVLGIVMRNIKNNTRTKLRNPSYETVRHLRGNQPKLQYQYLCLRQSNGVSDFLKYYPEHKKEFLFFRKCMHDFTLTLFANYIACYIKKEKPLKEYPENFRTHMFHIHKKYIDELKPNKSYVTNNVVINYVNKMSPTLQMYSLNYNMRKRRVDCFS